MRYFVDYNCKFIAMYKTLRGALNFVARKGLANDYDNSLRIVDSNGDMYHPFNGMKL